MKMTIPPNINFYLIVDKKRGKRERQIPRAQWAIVVANLSLQAIVTELTGAV
jgi:hypothetical protein